MGTLFTHRSTPCKAIILLILLISLTACTPDPNEVFIQGSWQYLDPHLQEMVGETYLETFWTFASGTYETSSCCFVRFQQYGSYNVLESEGDTLTLELFNIDGNFSSERVQIIVFIDREADTIKLTGAELSRASTPRVFLPIVSSSGFMSAIPAHAGGDFLVCSF